MTKPVYIKALSLGEGIPKICVPLTGETRQDIFAQAEAAVKTQPDLVEWRMDFWQEGGRKNHLEETLYGLSAILKDIPLLFTVRTVMEGGKYDGDYEEYTIFNRVAADSGIVSLVDVEVLHDTDRSGELIRDLHGRNVKVIGSSHDFEKTGTQEELLSRFQEMDRTQADILKLAVMSHDFSDAAGLMQAASRMRKEFTEKPLIAIAMGSTGAMSRIAGEAFGSCITFGTAGEASAPGQIPVEKLRTFLRAMHETLKE